MTTQRQDVLISVVIDGYFHNISTHTLKTLAERISATFAFFEIIVAYEDEENNDIETLAATIPNLRMMMLENGLERHEIRAILAQETIGDIIIFTPADTQYQEEIFALIASTEKNGKITYLSNADKSIFNPLLGLLSKSSNLRVNTRILPVSAYPRDAMLDILTRHNKHLALRFPPLSDKYTSELKTNAKKRKGNWKQRSTLLYLLSMTFTSKLLPFGWMMAILMVVSGLFTLFYTAGIYFLKTDVAAGWTTTMLFMGASAFWIGILSLIMIGVAKTLLGYHEGTSQQRPLRETTQVDVFSKVNRSQNVVGQEKKNA